MVLTRCKAGELAMVSRPIDGDDCTKRVVGRGVVQVERLDLAMSAANMRFVWVLKDPIPCPVDGCLARWDRWPDDCLRPLRDKPPEGEPDVYEAPKPGVRVVKPVRVTPVHRGYPDTIKPESI